MASKECVMMLLSQLPYVNADSLLSQVLLFTSTWSRWHKQTRFVWLRKWVAVNASGWGIVGVFHPVSTSDQPRRDWTKQIKSERIWCFSQPARLNIFEPNEIWQPACSRCLPWKWGKLELSMVKLIQQIWQLAFPRRLWSTVWRLHGMERGPASLPTPNNAGSGGLTECRGASLHHEHMMTDDWGKSDHSATSVWSS